MKSRRLVPLLFLLPLTLSAQTRPSDAEVDRAVAEALDSIVAVRHYIHRHPELGNREVGTARLVAEHLRGLGLEVDTGIAHTGVVAVLRGGRPGPVVAVRADMDALPVTEQTDLPFASTTRTTYLGQEVGVMHACGHDIHTAVQLGVASVLAGMRDRVPGTVKFLFQPAEEGPPPGERGGAELMVEEGVMSDAPVPEAVFGLHTLARMDVGEVGYTPGPSLAAVDHFYIRIVGEQAHGAQPQLSVDPVVMAAQAVLALQSIVSRNVHPLQSAVVTVGIVRGGTRFNIIPGDVNMEGTVRTYDPEVRDLIERRMGEILAGITAAGGGDYELNYERGTPATINDRELTTRMLPTLRRVVGADHVKLLDPTMGGEDFAYFANIMPGFFFRLGQVAPGTTSGDHHTPTFRADDTAIPVGMRVMTNLLLDYLSGTGR